MQSRSIAIAAFLMLAVVLSTEAQQPQNCAASLSSCAMDLNTTTTPQTECCDAIRQVVSTQLTCLCNLYNSPGLLSGLGINSTQALALPTRCNLPSDAGLCSAPAPGGSGTNPPGGNNESGSGRGNGVGTIALLLLLAFTNVLY